MSRPDLVSSADIDALVATPFSTKAQFAPPQGPERAGILTAPAFFKRFNNFRSRVRGIATQLLCQDIDASLNTDGIDTFENPDFSAADLAHGGKEGCDSCHYPMDNMGSTLFGWDDEGRYAVWPQQLSQLGHAFGQTGTGPAFLARAVVERAPGFRECMARRAFEDFTGESWAEQSAATRDEILAAADKPRGVIRAVLTSKSVLSLREPHAGDGVPSADATVSFEGSVNPILKSSCAGASCHSSGTLLGARYEFVDGESNFRGAPVQRLKDGSMPPADSGLVLSDAARETLVRFLSQ